MNKIAKHDVAPLPRKIWNYIETHHQDFGVGLFVLPVLLFVIAAAGVAQGAAWLLG
jgi:hypothetical protein